MRGRIIIYIGIALGILSLVVGNTQLHENFNTSEENSSTTVQILALYDYGMGKIYYKDEFYKACFSEELTNMELGRDEVLIIPENLNNYPTENNSSSFAKEFCRNFQIYSLDMFRIRLAANMHKFRSRRSAPNGYYPLERRGGASQSQIQGQVNGAGFFSGQAQSQVSGASQSQVQLIGSGISGSVSSSAGNAQAQIALGETSGSGQAGSGGHGPSNSQVQINLDRNGRMGSASVLSGGGGFSSGSEPHWIPGSGIGQNNLNYGSNNVGHRAQRDFSGAQNYGGYSNGYESQRSDDNNLNIGHQTLPSRKQGYSQSEYTPQLSYFPTSSNGNGNAGGGNANENQFREPPPSTWPVQSPTTSHSATGQSRQVDNANLVPSQGSGYVGQSSPNNAQYGQPSRTFHDTTGNQNGQTSQGINNYHARSSNGALNNNGNRYGGSAIDSTQSHRQSQDTLQDFQSQPRTNGYNTPTNNGHNTPTNTGHNNYHRQSNYGIDSSGTYGRDSSGKIPAAFASSYGGGQAQAQTVYLGSGTSDFYNPRSVSYTSESQPGYTNGNRYGDRTQTQQVTYNKAYQNQREQNRPSDARTAHRTSDTRTDHIPQRSDSFDSQYRTTPTPAPDYRLTNQPRTTISDGYVPTHGGFVRPYISPYDSSSSSRTQPGAQTQAPVQLPGIFQHQPIGSNSQQPSSQSATTSYPTVGSGMSNSNTQLERDQSQTDLRGSSHQIGRDYQGSVQHSQEYSQRNNIYSQGYTPTSTSGSTSGHSNGNGNYQKSQLQDGFAPAYGVSNEHSYSGTKTCTIITFTCTIIIESNGRAKICRPNTTQVNGSTGTNEHGHSNRGSSSERARLNQICCC